MLTPFRNLENKPVLRTDHKDPDDEEELNRFVGRFLYETAEDRAYVYFKGKERKGILEFWCGISEDWPWWLRTPKVHFIPEYSR